MIDPRATELEAAKDVEPIYHAELAKTRHIGPLLEGAAAVEAPWACSASAYSAASFGGVAFLLVGDAGSFIDPLSSFGIKKALASAWLAAVVVHTCLETPHMTGSALALFDRREADMYEAYPGEGDRGAGGWTGAAPFVNAAPGSPRTVEGMKKPLVFVRRPERSSFDIMSRPRRAQSERGRATSSTCQ